MPNAIITQTAYTGNGTQAGFLNALNTAMALSGFTLLKDYAISGNQQRVWQVEHDSSAYGKSIVELGFSLASTIRLRGFSAFNTTTNAASDISTASPVLAINLGINWNFYAINHPEMRGVMLLQDLSNIGFVGIFRPLPVPDWYSTTAAPYAFILRTLGTAWGTTTLQPISTLRAESIGNNSIIGNTANARSQGGNSGNRVLKLSHMEDETNRSHIASFSSDILCGASAGMVTFDSISTPSGNYSFIEGSASTTVSKVFIKTP